MEQFDGNSISIRYQIYIFGQAKISVVKCAAGIGKSVKEINSKNTGDFWNYTRNSARISKENLKRSSYETVKR